MPISFTATATDNCDTGLQAEIRIYDCFLFTKKGKRIDKTESCIVEINGDQISILDTGGVDTTITWTVESTDDCGNYATFDCEIDVINPTE